LEHFVTKVVAGDYISDVGTDKEVYKVFLILTDTDFRDVPYQPTDYSIHSLKFSLIVWLGSF
jgi:hypothetical protein